MAETRSRWSHAHGRRQRRPALGSPKPRVSEKVLGEVTSPGVIRSAVLVTCRPGDQQGATPQGFMAFTDL
jgi:hypothetical protein